MTSTSQQTTYEPLPPVPGSALEDYTPPPKYRRWEFALTLETWALPLCITRFHCGAWTIQFLCFELHTSIAHRWPNEVFIDEQRRLGKDVTELEAEQDMLCRMYFRQYGGRAIRISQNKP